MLGALIPIVTLLAQYVPMLSTAIGALGASASTVAAIKNVVDIIEVVGPAAIQEGRDLLPTIKNIIATIRGTAGTPAEQLDRLDVIEAQIDANWDADLAKARAEDAAAAKT